jgi:superoxide dismutase
MAIQGSGWVYLARNGKIKTIVNHEIRSDIILLIDWWEHSYNLQYHEDKKSYLKNIWRAIDWSVINDRINLDNT